MNEPTISLEYQIPEPLFRQLQQALDRYPHTDADSFITQAMRCYLRLLERVESRHPR